MNTLNTVNQPKKPAAAIPRRFNPWGENWGEVIPNPEKSEQDSKKVNFPQEELTIHAMWESMLTPKAEGVQREEHTETVKVEMSQIEIGGVTSLGFQKIEAQEPEIKTKPKEQAAPTSPKAEVSRGLEDKGLLAYVDFNLLFDKSSKAVSGAYSASRELAFAYVDIFLYIFGFSDKLTGSKESKPRGDGQKEKKPNILASGLALLGGAIIGLERKLLVKKQREDVNRKLNTGNLSYEGYVSDSGEIRTDILTELDKANSQLGAAQVKASKEKRLATATKGKRKGPGVVMEMDKAAESGSHVTKLLG